MVGTDNGGTRCWHVTRPLRAKSQHASRDDAEGAKRRVTARRRDQLLPREFAGEIRIGLLSEKRFPWGFRITHIVPVP